MSMIDYDLYMSVGGEVSDDTDLYNLAVNSTYFSIEPDDGRMIGEGMIDDMPVFRKEWEQVIVKNNPYQYKQGGGNANKLYNIIFDNPTTTIFFLKIVRGSQTIYGYFGEVDCEINEDRSLITIKPAIVDQYTDFIENYEEDIDVFGGQNLIRNGNFNVWTDNWPNSWDSGTGVTRQTLVDRNWAALGQYLNGTQLSDSRIEQNIQVGAGSTALFSFLYALVGVPDHLYDLEFRVSLREKKFSTPVYYLKLDGSWIVDSEILAYDTNVLPVPKDTFGDIGDVKRYRLVTQPTPIAGIVTLEFFFRDPNMYVYENEPNKPYLYITGVDFKASEIKYVSVSLTFSTDNLKPKWQEEIIDFDTSAHPWFSTRIKRKDLINKGILSGDGDTIISLAPYFNENGSPNMTLLADEKFGPHDGSARYPDWVKIFTEEPDSTFYRGEMCELTIGVGGQTWNWGVRYRNIKARAKFAREEIYLDDPTDGSDPVPPEEDLGWWDAGVNTSISSKRLWVRTPYYGAYSGVNETWELGNLITESGKELNFDYRAKQTTTKIYPTGENSTTIGAGMDFRDVCRKIYRGTHPSRLGKEVYSAFFWNDSPYMDFLELDGPLNYYNMRTNFLNYIATIHTSEIKRITDPALSDSELKVSFKKLFDDLRVKFPSLVWFIDENQNLHFEHHRFLHRVRSYVDMTGNTIPQVGEYKSYSYNTEKLFGNIVREDVNTYYKDFKRSEEKFRKITTNKRGKDKKKELRTSFISTDIKGAIENPGDLGNGMILVAYEITDAGNNSMIYGTGQITGNDMPNGVLATSYLLKQFGNYVGTWHRGIIDGEEKDYQFSQHCKVGKEIKLQGIIKENYLFTDIGMALIQKKKFDYENEVTLCTPIYRHIDYYIIAEQWDELQFDYYVDDFLAN